MSQRDWNQTKKFKAKKNVVSDIFDNTKQGHWNENVAKENGNTSPFSLVLLSNSPPFPGLGEIGMGFTLTDALRHQTSESTSPGGRKCCHTWGYIGMCRCEGYSFQAV